MKQKPDLTIVIPAFQEEAVIGSTLSKLKVYVESELKKIQVEVILVVADSTDRTLKIVKEHSSEFKRFKIVQPGKKVGKGRDVREGVLKSSGRYVLFTDADLATPLHHIGESLELMIEGGGDLVIGIRDLSDIHSGIRKIVSLGANLITRSLIEPKIKDTQCGFKVFTEDSAKYIFNGLTKVGWDFDIEVIAIAKSKGYTIINKPVLDWSENKAEQDQLVGENTMVASIRSLRSTLNIAYRLRMGKYK